ncbi:hypothetical protein C0Q70_13431 [Pomacea canaliculata]|uniref:Cap-specific mRNA (nucleoside-2'-O-)-methyltransferase 1 n=1 Tax=Pomacea canaliculata TaxID=400727 RepID=A0A2T7NX73_POMCA|nr:hypothetical protein C0Q70_13431 [Pomacea canaliculata]
MDPHSDELDDRPSFGQTTNQSVAMKTKGTVKRTFDKIKDAREKGDEDDDDNLSADKYIKIMPQQGVQNPLAMKMMMKMGFKEGSGLGKHSQGRREIVEASKQRGRRGLGHKVEGFEPADIEWDFEKEKIIMQEEVAWIPPSDGNIPSFEEMMSWKVIGEKKRTIDDETMFCNENILEHILLSKASVFDNLEGEEMRRARTKSNPYETIRGAFFLNRAAMKMANMDAMFDFMFTNPVDDHGVGGLQGDGDIFRPKNQEAFINFVLNNTDGKGVHFCMADGGFSVEGQENIQEILSKQLYLCQFLVALGITREGGHFVCKLFDLFTPFSVGLVYLMRLVFNQVCICKPVTSRPANSERYIVCKGLRPNKAPVLKYMDAINQDLCKLLTSVSTTDVNHIVPLQTLLDDEDFFTYIYNSNVKNLHEIRQSDVRKQCLERWQIPNEVRTAPIRQDPQSAFNDLVGESEQDILKHVPLELDRSNLDQIDSVYDYMCVVSGDSERTFMISCGKSVVFFWDRKVRKWKKPEQMRVDLPTKTLLEVEFVTELRGEGKGQRKVTTVHVMDALFLCGKDIRSRHFRERLDQLQKFVKAVHKETRSDLVRLVMPDVFKLEEAALIFDRLEMKLVKGSGSQPRLCFHSQTGNFYHPSGISFVKTVKDPWTMALSKKQQKKYWFNKRQPNSATFECHHDSIATFRDCKLTALRWTWSPGVRVHEDQNHHGDIHLSKEDFITFVQNKLK